MINKQYLQFNVLTKPKKDLFKVVQANAKFKTLNDVLRTKVGINNFYNFSIAIESSIVMRDIILNSQFVSGWARSSQVLNKTDSKFSGYRFLTRDKEETNKWIRIMESLEMQGHTMDNMRSLIYLDSITNYAISIDILHLLYITIVLDSIYNNLDETHDDLKDEIANHPTRKFLDPWRNSISNEEFHEQFVVYKLAHGTATLWTMAKNMEPKEVVQL